LNLSNGEAYRGRLKSERFERHDSLKKDKPPSFFTATASSLTAPRPRPRASVSPESSATQSEAKE
jgi:hypothetical protein